MKNIFFTLFLFLLIPISVLSQEKEKLISGDFNQIKFPDFIKQIESQTNIQFFFKQYDIQNIIINSKFEDATIDECLATITKGLLLNYSIINNQIFLYNGEALSNLFSNTNEESSAEIVKSTEDISLEKLRKKQYELNNIGKPGANKTGSATITGLVTTFKTGEPVIACNIYTQQNQRGTSTDKHGRYSLKLPVGYHTLIFSSIEVKSAERQIRLYSNGSMNVEMESKINLLSDVEILGDQNMTLDETHMGMERIDIKSMKNLPAILGEPDIIKSAMILPGVNSVGEGTSGFNVRGGKTDQNLILIDNSPIYYPSHFFGNFSAINSEMIQDATLYKGSMPANYGGRISSVYQINTKEGSYKELEGAAGISTVSTKVKLEGPVQANKSSFLVSFRSTYSDWILKQIKTDAFYNSSVNFYDVQAKLSFKLNKRNKLLFNSYWSDDGFSLKSDTIYKYRNGIFSAILNTKNNGDWEMQNSLSFSSFNYNIEAQADSLRAFEMTHGLQDISFKNNTTYHLENNVNVSIGGEAQLYNVNPGERNVPPYSEVSTFSSNTEHAIELGVFTSVDLEPVDRLNIEAGVRLSGFFSLADGSKNIYKPGLALTEKNLVEVVSTKKNSLEKFYFNPEFRLSTNYMLTPLTSLKCSYNLTTQYLHMLTNTTAISPTDTWKLSDLYLTPQKGQQVSLGFVNTNYQNTFELSLEGYYKQVKNVKEYKAGADLLLNDHIETEIINGKGKSYGAELSLQKRGGRLTGRLGYTYSRTLIKTESEFEEEQINNGEYFPASYDTPHNLNVLASYKILRRLIFSSTLNYSTGRPITYPVTKYIINDQVFLHYSDYNQFRIPDYFRIDASITVDSSLKLNKSMYGALTFSIYNLTGRRNAYSIYFRNTSKSFEGYKLSIFGEMIPTIAYNIRF